HPDPACAFHQPAIRRRPPNPVTAPAESGILFAMDIRVGAQPLHVAARGESGSAVILLHSSGLSSQQWRRLAERLAPAHRTFAPDLIGYGKSPPFAGGRDVTWRDDVEVIVGLARSVGGPVHLVGHSYGGLVALAAALELAPASLSVYDPP